MASSEIPIDACCFHAHAFDDLTLSDANDAYKDAITIKDFVLNNFLK